MLDRRSDHKRRARQARYRERQRLGICLWRVEITAERYETLTRLGYLRNGVTDPREGGQAIERLIDGIEI
jgi:hypothetical protein